MEEATGEKRDVARTLIEARRLNQSKKKKSVKDTLGGQRGFTFSLPIWAVHVLFLGIISLACNTWRRPLFSLGLCESSLVCSRRVGTSN